MFLDDELLKMCKDVEINTPDDVKKLNENVCALCESYYKSKVGRTSSVTEIKTILDKTFNLFDSFVISLNKSDDHKLLTFGKVFKIYTFKKQFLANKEMADIYNKL